MIESRPENKRTRLRYADVLDQCQDIAVIFSGSQLAELFEHAGTALLDFAERAENNSMQSHFFEAMGLIQRRRTDMEKIFRREIDRQFEQFGNLEKHEPGMNSPPSSRNALELSLVGHEEIEESVAAENLIIKANANFFPELYALSQRLAVIVGGKKLKDFEIPAGPHHLVHSFRSSMAGLEVEVRIKVILYALFDKFVVKQAKGLYDELNDNLKNAGILPNLKPVHTRPQGSSGGPERKAEQQEQEGAEAHPQTGAGPMPEEQAPVSLGAELFDSIIDLMSMRHGARHNPVRQRPTAAAPSGQGATAAVSRDLVTAVGRVQSRTTPDSVRATVADATAIPNLEVDTAFVERVKETLNQEREQVLSQIDRDKLSTMDSDLIDLIGLLFEYMLNDPVLPNLAKALLSHLHTPYLKVALIDRRLLVDESHPARRLFDQMVDAGNLWVDENNPKHGIFPTMQAVVNRVLKEFTDNVELFEELSESFVQAMKEQQRKTDTIEQRTQEVARGREKLQLAKRRAREEIRTLLQRTPLPAPVVSFLSKTWLDQLVFILLRDEQEERSDVWKQAVKTAEDLVSLFEPKAGAAALDTDKSMIADLRTRINEDVQRMGSYTHPTMEALFTLLDAPEIWEESCARAAAAQPEKPGIDEATDDLTAIEDTVPSQSEISEKEQEVIRRLRKMKFGTWFEFRSGTGEVTRRIKLSWLSPLTATCMFVDRSGLQAEIKTLRELAGEILSGRAKVIPRPKHPFIERALVSIRNMLQGGDEPTPDKEAPQRQ